MCSVNNYIFNKYNKIHLLICYSLKGKGKFLQGREFVFYFLVDVRKQLRNVKTTMCLLQWRPSTLRHRHIQSHLLNSYLLNFMTFLVLLATALEGRGYSQEIWLLLDTLLSILEPLAYHSLNRKGNPLDITFFPPDNLSHVPNLDDSFSSTVTKLPSD